MTGYNKYYKKEDYFGKPYPELIKYFNVLNKDLTILDLGCGQGRDSLALGRLGFKVVGIDTSSVGINQLNTIAEREGLEVEGIVGDLNEVSNMSTYDIILMDSMFHFYKKDIEGETKMLSTLLELLKNKGRLVIVVQESKFRMNYLRKIIKTSKVNVIIESEQSFLYPEFNSNFFMISVQKQTS